ncbi:homeobox domain-containing protein [Circinella umbellata]|nr:homeobox domain-containing protein [Circinella umbellata]
MNHPSLLTASANVPSQQQLHHHQEQSQQQPKKRTRVTPSQLTILEETFAISATPDSKMRKQLAQKLQMPERSIQIWFQNRRAKVKMLQKRAIMREEQEAAKARLYAEAAAYVHNHHHQPYWYPPSALTVGTWHRMKITQQDLLCHYHSTERTFAWHIRDSDYHFKMVVSFDTIASIEINTLPDNVSADIHLDLAEPPLFFMENGGDNNWIQCSDFTEGMQATCILRHTIRGLTADLRQELFNIASLDDGLCQVTQFFTTPNTTTPSVAIMAAAQAAGVASSSEPPSVFDQNLLWRHQSLPLGFGWTGDETSSSF